MNPSWAPQPRAPKSGRCAHITAACENQQGFCLPGWGGNLLETQVLLKSHCKKSHSQPLTLGLVEGGWSRLVTWGETRAFSSGEGRELKAQPPGSSAEFHSHTTDAIFLGRSTPLLQHQTGECNSTTLQTPCCPTLQKSYLLSSQLHGQECRGPGRLRGVSVTKLYDSEAGNHSSNLPPRLTSSPPHRAIH